MAAVPPTAWGSWLMPGLCLRALNTQQVPGCLWAPWSRNVPPEHPQTRLPQQMLRSPSSPSAMSSWCTVVFQPGICLRLHAKPSGPVPVARSAAQHCRGSPPFSLLSAIRV